ncbi:collagen alpha-1(I) chain-like [Aquila chrysaetos chrysaetos]|uniref:collagen alpha-1(I) chain-like n=1 Tax=Aquila chrysaetos chrysaetos TaxID=223781 RepID=UPI001176998F|nr:collagen alpha-1(I) chain-like [Aquila chrysaetos chrysaetos]
MRGPREPRGGAQGAGLGGSGRAPGPRVRRAIPSGGGRGCLLPAGRPGLPGREAAKRPPRQAPGPPEASRARAAPGSSPRAGRREEGTEAGTPQARPAGASPSRQSSPGPARPVRLPPAPAPPLKPVLWPQAAPEPCREGSKPALRCSRVSLNVGAASSGAGNERRLRKPLRKEGAPVRVELRFDSS